MPTKAPAKPKFTKPQAAKRPRQPSTARLAKAFERELMGCATDEDRAVIEAASAANEAAQQPKILSRRQTRQLDTLASLRTADPYERDRAWVSDALIFCPLPFRRPVTNQVVRTARLSATEEVEVIYTATDTASLPFGEDAFLLDLLASEARKRQQPEISFESLTEIIELLGQKLRGGKDAVALRERVERLSGLHIRLKRKGVVNVNIRVVDVENAGAWDTHREASGERPLMPYVFRLAPEFFMDLMNRYTVIPLEILRAFVGSPVEYSFARWVYRRAVNARKPTLITWDEIQAERGSEDTHTRRFRMKVRAVVKKLKQAWPELASSIEDTPDGLRVMRPATAMIPDRMLPALALDGDE